MPKRHLTTDIFIMDTGRYDTPPKLPHTGCDAPLVDRLFGVSRILGGDGSCGSGRPLKIRQRLSEWNARKENYCV